MRGNKGKPRKSGKLLHGVGLNDADYAVCPRENGKIVWCKFYRVWSSMLWRCYSKTKDVNSPTYKGVQVCEEWLRFSNFKAWMEKQDWEGKELDKDLLIEDNKIYSPSTCVFVTHKVNGFITDCRATRGEYPLGVCLYKALGKFGSHCHENKELKYLGLFDTPEEAHWAYKKFKAGLAVTLIQEQENPAVAEALFKRYVEGVLE